MASTEPLAPGQIPAVPWATLQARLTREWKPGEHITIVGPTGSGKTHIGLHLAELCRYILFLATKRSDPLVSALQAHGYLVTSNLDDVLWTEEHGPVTSRVVYWPQTPARTAAKERHRLLGEKMRRALTWAEETGQWTVVADETMFLAGQLGLGDDLDSLWFQGRTQGVSVIAMAQRPAYVPRLAFSQATYLFLAQTSDANDLERLRDIAAGFPRKMIEQAVTQLDWHAHEFLFIDTRERAIARVVAPPR